MNADSKCCQHFSLWTDILLRYVFEQTLHKKIIGKFEAKQDQPLLIKPIGLEAKYALKLLGITCMDKAASPNGDDLYNKG